MQLVRFVKAEAIEMQERYLCICAGLWLEFEVFRIEYLMTWFNAYIIIKQNDMIFNHRISEAHLRNQFDLLQSSVWF